jgi:putative ABC transport system permease protein
VSGLRRALGARRRDILRQHLVEVVLIGVAGGVGGLAVAYGGLWLLRNLLYLPLARASGNPGSLGVSESLTQLDLTMLVATLGISILFGVLAGLYPAWRVGRDSPAAFLSKK